MRLNRAMLYVKDLHRMAAFDGDTLELRLIGETRTDAWVEFNEGSTKFALHAMPPQTADEIEIFFTSPAPREESREAEL